MKNERKWNNIVGKCAKVYEQYIAQYTFEFIHLYTFPVVGIILCFLHLILHILCYTQCMRWVCTVYRYLVCTTTNNILHIGVKQLHRDTLGVKTSIFIEFQCFSTQYVCTHLHNKNSIEQKKIIIIFSTILFFTCTPNLLPLL